MYIMDNGVEVHVAKDFNRNKTKLTIKSFHQLLLSSDTVQWLDVEHSHVPSDKN